MIIIINYDHEKQLKTLETLNRLTKQQLFFMHRSTKQKQTQDNTNGRYTGIFVDGQANAKSDLHAKVVTVL